ncbi:hypothetical protein KHS38_17720 [Mucilaginibacter sp. Bleaf8]|uniref:ATP-binding protein n=1 Tax=Mucilaginibacter sp. Bleaf8 TaxID=2834430 RepID=UPI001BCC4687|nr:hypothetical protein [Mucilaginibacter sp. Bleaf8]MBS7566251.1 hypothetical protein [Mucilaginibacter sp. Bleaf8]
MSNSIFKQQFTFDTRSGSLMPLTEQVLDCIALQLQNYAEAEDILFRAKYIIIELLTNALKHSGTGEAHLSVVISADELQIIKADAGNPLPLLNAAMPTGQTRVMVAYDVMHTLYAVLGEEVRFVCEENALENLDISKIHEHFGLLIITKTADEFSYRYRKPDNIFTAKLRLYR